MRLVTILALMAVVLVGLCQPASTQKLPSRMTITCSKTRRRHQPPEDVTVIQGTKRFGGWIMDNGRFIIERNGKTIMDGWVTRTGAVTLSSTLSDDTYVGQVNPMGNGLLMSPKTGDTVRIEVQR